MNRSVSCLLASAALVLCASSASAKVATLDFNLASKTGVLGASQTYTSKGQTLTASAYDAYATGGNQARAVSSPLTLAGSAQGLGLAYTPAVAAQDNETNEVSTTGIIPTLQSGTLVEHYGFVQIDVSGIKNLESLSFTAAYPTADGLADGDSWQVIGSNTYNKDATSGANPPGTVIASGSETGPVTLYSSSAGGPSYKYYDFISLVDPLGSKYLNHKVANDAFSIGAISATAAVPEPASWSLMILGVGGVGAALRRRRRMVAA